MQGNLIIVQVTVIQMWLMEIRLERRKKTHQNGVNNTHKKQGLSQSLTLLCDETARSHSSRTHYYMCFRQREAFRWRGNTRRCVVTEDSCVIFIHWSHVLATYQSHEQVLSVLIITLTLSLSPLSFFDCILYFCLFCWSVSRTVCDCVRRTVRAVPRVMERAFNSHDLTRSL